MNIQFGRSWADQAEISSVSVSASGAETLHRGSAQTRGSRGSSQRQPFAMAPAVPVR